MHDVYENDVGGVRRGEWFGVTPSPYVGGPQLMDAKRHDLYETYKQYALDTASDVWTVFGKELQEAKWTRANTVAHALMTLAKIVRELDLYRDDRQTVAYIRTQLENRMSTWAQKVLHGRDNKMLKAKPKPEAEPAKTLPGPCIVVPDDDEPMKDPTRFDPDEVRTTTNTGVQP